MDAVFETEKGIFNYRVAGVCLVNDHVLLHKEVDGTHWSLPGGRVGVAEASQEALRREFQEELGVEVSVRRLLWSVENFFIYKGNNVHEIGFYYEVSFNEEYPFETKPFWGIEGERLLYQWIPVIDLEEIVLYPEFLKTELKDIKNAPSHFVVK